MSDHFAIIPLEPRPTGTAPVCRICSGYVYDGLTTNGRAVDPICPGCGAAALAGRYRPSLLEWAGGVKWGRLLAADMAVDRG